MIRIAPRYKWLFAIFVLFILPVMYLSRASQPVVKQSNSTLRIAAFNLFYLAEQSELLAQQIQNWDLDIVIFLEYTGKNVSRQLMEKSGYRADAILAETGTHGIAIYSKKQLSLKAAVMASPVKGPCGMPFAVAKLMLHGRPLNIIGVHVPPPIPACNNTTDRSIEAIAQWVNDGKLQNKLSVLSKGAPTVIAGDFNAFPFNSVLNKLEQKGFVDAEPVCAYWLCPTWSPHFYMPAMIRIDYIFVPRQFRIQKSWTATIAGSDHRAIIADVDLKMN